MRFVVLSRFVLFGCFAVGCCSMRTPVERIKHPVCHAEGVCSKCPFGCETCAMSDQCCCWRPGHECKCGDKPPTGVRVR